MAARPFLGGNVENNYHLAIPISKRFTKEIGAVCNKKFHNAAQMSITIATLIFRTMLIGAMRQIYKPGSLDGTEFIDKVYESAKKDAHNVWTDS